MPSFWMFHSFACWLHDAECLLGIAQGDFIVSVRHTVGQYGVCNALAVEPVCHIMPFVVHGEMAVSTSRAHHDGKSVAFFSGIDFDGRFCYIERAFFHLAGHAVVIGRAVLP